MIKTLFPAPRRIFVTLTCALSSLLFATYSVKAMENEKLFTWDDREEGTGLHIFAKGKDKTGADWTGREVHMADLPFYQKMYGDSEVMRFMQNGKPKESEEIITWLTTWTERSAKGIPYGSLIIEQDDIAVGCLQFSKIKPGVGTFSRLFIPSSQGKGLGTAVLSFLVKDWAPAIRKMGLGQDKEAPSASVERLKEFEQEPLRLIYTTARPSNVASWGCYEKFGFTPSPANTLTYQINCEGWEKTQHGSMEDYLLDTYFSSTSLHPLEKDTNYNMVDPNGKYKTLSYESHYEGLRYHFDHEVT